jgi:hypothetical protein
MNNTKFEVPIGTRKVKVGFDMDTDLIVYHVELINSPSSYYWGAVLIDSQKNLIDAKIQSTDMCGMEFEVGDGDDFQGKIHINRDYGFFLIEME